ncbi:methyltransferase domain-containing protein [Gordonia sp. PKS22-38]|uniref:Methyltransferase domain-containing protein n=1 Tax=Gordonia prachuapensis TaxID=3115651 RepID=A0ABU7MW74_9ACTN|nr:methyltransferase domain-containing protein [Gordonia sp. PKS22-38]
MTARLSPRLVRVVDALPLRPGLRVLEIGCGPGSAAREMATRVTPGGRVLGIDRSARAIDIAIAGSAELIGSGVLDFSCAAIEDFALSADEPPFDVAVAVRVGALDGRHPEIFHAALRRISAALTTDGRLWIDAPTGSDKAIVELCLSPR